MDFQIKKNRITLWEGEKYIATITVNESNNSFNITVNGMGNSIRFKDAKGLKKYLKQNCSLKIEIPKEIYDHIDAWQVMFKLTSPF